MKEFLEDLEALLIKHPDIEICSKWLAAPVGITNQKKKIYLASEAEWLTIADIQRFKRELWSK